VAADQLKRVAGQVVKSRGVRVGEDRLCAGHRCSVLMFAERDLGEHEIELDPQALIGGIQRQRLLALLSGAVEMQPGVRGLGKLQPERRLSLPRGAASLQGGEKLRPHIFDRCAVPGRAQRRHEHLPRRQQLRLVGGRERASAAGGRDRGRQRAALERPARFLGQIA